MIQESPRRAYINSVATVLPRYTGTSEEFFAFDSARRRELGQKEEVIDFCAKIRDKVAIDTRYSIHPCFISRDTWAGRGIPPAKDIYTPAGFNPKMGARMAAWTRELLPLAVQAAGEAVRQWGGDPARITHVITASTTGWVEPGMAAKVITELGLPMTTEKAELIFNGCFSGMTALRLGRDTVLADPRRTALVVAAESATTHYGHSTEPSRILSQYLFGDGIGAAVISSQGEWEMSEWGSFLIKNTLKKMTYHQSTEPEFDGFVIKLSPQVPEIIRRALQRAPGKDVLAKVAPRTKENPHSKIAAHPGGRGILDAIREVAMGHGWAEDSLDEAYRSLRATGNTAAAAIFYVLEQFVGKDVPERDLISLGFGPGMTTEWGILRRAGKGR